MGAQRGVARLVKAGRVGSAARLALRSHDRVRTGIFSVNRPSFVLRADDPCIGLMSLRTARNVLPGAVEIERAGRRFLLLPQRAVFLPETKTLLVADVHLGKAATFRRLGVPVPQGTTSENLRLLTQLIQTWSAERVVFLGDLLHGPYAHAESTLAAVHDWVQHHAGVRRVLVRGNHDLRAGDPPPDWGIETVEEPWLCEGLRLYHHPPVEDPPSVPGYALAGHAHPCVELAGPGRDRLRLPCFQMGPQRGILPAFGSFTGMHPVTPASGDELYAIAEDRVMRLPVEMLHRG